METNHFSWHIQSSWKKANTKAKFLPKDMASVNLIYLNRDQLILDKSHYLSTKYHKESPTKFKARITGKGSPRIYKGFETLGYKWNADVEKYIPNDYGECDLYYFVKIGGESYVILLNFEHPFDIDDIK